MANCNVGPPQADQVEREEGFLLALAVAAPAAVAAAAVRAGEGRSAMPARAAGVAPRKMMEGEAAALPLVLEARPARELERGGV